MDTYEITALDTAHDVVEQLVEHIGFDTFSARVDPVASEAYPGFIPYTDGGWDGIITFDLHSEVSQSVPGIRDDVERDYDEMVAAFRAEHDLSPDADLEGGPEIWEHPEWEQFSTEWQYGGDPTCWFVKVRALFYRQGHHRNVSGEDEFLFCMGVCNDFNYGRDHISWAKGVGTTWFWERNVTAAELIAPEGVTGLVAEMKQAWSSYT